MHIEQTDRRVEPWVRVALVGGGLWSAWVLAWRPEWTEVLLLLSPFVLVPLGLRLATGPETGPVARPIRHLGGLTPLVATTAALSFLPEPGMLAAALSVPWLVLTGVIALGGMGRVLSRRTLAHPGIGADAGLMFLAVGGIWLTISRAGLNPLGFSDVIVQLTAVHFHYAGFALPIVAGLVASRLNRSVIAPLAVTICVPLTAAGITIGGAFEWLAATAMAVAGLITASMLVLLGIRQAGTAQLLIAGAGISLMGGMSLALGWAWSIHFGWSFLGLDEMAATHGSLNALGFGLLGLIGLNILPTAPGPDAEETNIHLVRPTVPTLRQLAADAAQRHPANPIGLLDRPANADFQRRTWTKRVPHEDFDAAAAAIRQWSGHRTAGIELYPACPDIAVGETLALAIPVGPISVSATCRIIDVVDEPDRYGFTYATLAHHPEDGEESFTVSRGPDGEVDVTVTAVWRAATIANHVCPPLTRHLQNRAIGRYLHGIAEGHDSKARAAACD